MSTNLTFVSGVLTGEVENFSKDGAYVKVNVAEKAGYSSDFVLGFYGESAKEITENFALGSRIAVLGRLTREKLAGDYEDIISVTRILSISPATSFGKDYAYAVVSGKVGKVFVNEKNTSTSVESVRNFNKSDGSRAEYKTFIRLMFWKGTDLEEGQNVQVAGTLKGSLYGKADTTPTYQITVWADNDSVESASSGAAAPKAAAPKRSKATDVGNVTDEDLPF